MTFRAVDGPQNLGAFRRVWPLHPVGVNDLPPGMYTRLWCGSPVDTLYSNAIRETTGVPVFTRLLFSADDSVGRLEAARKRALAPFRQLNMVPASTGVFHDAEPSILVVAAEMGLTVRNIPLEGHPEPFARDTGALSFARIACVETEDLSILFFSGLILPRAPPDATVTDLVSSIERTRDQMLAVGGSRRVTQVSMLVFVDPRHVDFEEVYKAVVGRFPDVTVVPGGIAIPLSQIEIEMIATLEQCSTKRP